MSKFKIKNKRTFVIKSIATLLVLVVLIVSTVYLFPIISKISTPAGQVEFRNVIKHSGLTGALMLFGLDLSQIVLAILPGEPIEVIAGMCYGSIGGTLFLLFCSFISSVIIFFAIRKFGKDIVYNFCSKQQIDKLENSDFFKDPNKFARIMYILFLIPGTPKDLLTYVSGLVPVKCPIKFLIICTLARIPSIISSTIVGANLVNGAWWISAIAYAVTFGIVGIVVVFYRFFSKDEDVKKAVKILK